MKIPGGNGCTGEPGDSSAINDKTKARAGAALPTPAATIAAEDLFVVLVLRGRTGTRAAPRAFSKDLKY